MADETDLEQRHAGLAPFLSSNFPADVMRDMRGVGKGIGVDLSARSTRRLVREYAQRPASLV
jgi:hypothetical protein